jgi:hypothetical protein
VIISFPASIPTDHDPLIPELHPEERMVSTGVDIEMMELVNLYIGENVIV